jgi:hypothetical protein
MLSRPSSRTMKPIGSIDMLQIPDPDGERRRHRVCRKPASAFRRNARGESRQLSLMVTIAP